MTDEGEMIADRYRLITQVGRGAMGVVWQAYDERLSRPVAVKQLLLHSGASPVKAEEAKRRAMREARITARLHHPHAITVYDVAEHDGKPCLIMEYLRSESLSTVLATRGALAPGEAARIGSQITSALVAAHDAGIVHRDIKPGNVLIAPDGTAKITDFGISRAAGDGTVTATGVLAGTPAFFAPEVAKGHNADFPADVFSLGATLYAAVEGEPPFGLDENAIALLFRITTSEINLPERAGSLAPVLMSALDRDPARRPTMQQMQAALTAVVEHREPAADTLIATAVPPPPAPTREAAAAGVLPDSAPTPPPAASASTQPTAAAPTPPTPSTAAAPVPPAPASAASAGAGPKVPGPRAGAPRVPRQMPVRPGAVAAVVVSLIVVGVALVALLNRGPDSPDQAAGPPAASRDAAQGQTRAETENQPQPEVPQPAPTVGDAPTQPTPAPEQPAAPPPATSAPPRTSAPPAADVAAPPATPEQQAAAVADYYAVVPGDLQAGWARLTAGYQREHAGGFASYQEFWSAVERVEVSGLSVTRPGTVQATLDYFYKDGRVIQERTSFGLVAEDGIWKIGSTAVISSRSKN